MTAGEIAGRFAHAWPTTTRHIRVLESAGLLVQEKHGRHRLYRVNRDMLRAIAEWLSWFELDEKVAAPTRRSKAPSK